jgi:hypothetical protein
LDELTDEQRKAYALVHNQLTMNSGFDNDLLSLELDSIADIDMSEFGFDLDIEEPIDAPTEFKTFDENIETKHKCPRCGYEY